MPRPKKTDQKPVEKPKSKTTAKRRKDKEEDADDLEEFEEKPEKKLKVGSQDKGKARISILGVLNRMQSEWTSAEIHSFKSLKSALDFRKDLIMKFEGEEQKNRGRFPYFDKKSKEHVYEGSRCDGVYSITIKEFTVDELLAGEDVNIKLYSR